MKYICVKCNSKNEALKMARTLHSISENSLNFLYRMIEKSFSLQKGCYYFIAYRFREDEKFLITLICYETLRDYKLKAIGINEFCTQNKLALLKFFPWVRKHNIFIFQNSLRIYDNSKDKC